MSSEAAGMVKRQVESGKAGMVVDIARVAVVETPPVVSESVTDAALLEA